MWQMRPALNLMCVSSQDQPSYSGLVNALLPRLVPQDTPIACKSGSWLFSLEPKAPQWAMLAVVKSSIQLTLMTMPAGCLQAARYCPTPKDLLP